MLRKFIRQSYNEPQVLAAVRNPQTLVMMSQGLGFRAEGPANYLAQSIGLGDRAYE